MKAVVKVKLIDRQGAYIADRIVVIHAKKGMLTEASKLAETGEKSCFACSAEILTYVDYISTR